MFANKFLLWSTITRSQISENIKIFRFFRFLGKYRWSRTCFDWNFFHRHSFRATSAQFIASTSVDDKILGIVVETKSALLHLRNIML